MIIVKDLTVAKPFMYIWLKRVTGVDLDQHCARCLLGSYHPAINNQIKHIPSLELEDGVWYLCGVSKPYRWKNNFHLAFEYSAGSEISYSSNGISLTIENAKQLPINEEYVNPQNVHCSQKEYYTCRNWQFANYLASNKI